MMTLTFNSFLYLERRTRLLERSLLSVRRKATTLSLKTQMKKWKQIRLLSYHQTHLLKNRAISYTEIKHKEMSHTLWHLLALENPLLTINL